MESLKNMKRLQLYTICRSRESTIQWLLAVNLLQRNPICEHCSLNYELKPTEDNLDGCRWKCYGRRCGKSTMSIRKNSFFFNSRLSLQNLVFIMYEWARETPITEVCFQYGNEEHTVCDWYRFFRDVCIEKLCLFNAGKQIGGPGAVCEIDETCVVRRKHQVGRIVPTTWLVGGIIRSEQFEMFLEIVPDRSARTLEELIVRNVHERTKIITDKWGGYIHLDRMVSNTNL